MKLTKIGAVALAALLVTAGAAAAMPGSGNAVDAPADTHANEHASDDHGQADEHGNDSATANESESPNENASADASDRERGPPTDMPAPVPDHVSEVHETIQKYLDDKIANLGEVLGGILGGDQAVAQDEHANESGNETTTTTEPTTTSDDSSSNTTTSSENTTTTTTTSA